MESERNESVEYVLAECCSLDDLQDPLKRSTRLKYNCISVSTRYVAIGTNTGGIYIFSRTDHKLLQIAFAEKATNSVTSVLLSPNEKLAAIVCGTTVHVIDMKLDSRSKPETLRSTDVRDTRVTALFWDTTSSRLYIGDIHGKVYLILVHLNKAKNLFSLPLEVIMKLDSQVVQIDKLDDKLLVSTLTRCYLSDTSKQQYSQIGKKLRDGQFGACFMSQNSSGAMIYCARPGSRIWEVDYNGNVLNTHQFKQLLAIPPSTILHPAGIFDPPDKSATCPGQAVVFPQLKVICKSFIMSWTSSSIYVLDPVNVKVVLWSDSFSEIQDICCVEDKIFVFLQDMQIRCVSVLPVTSTIPLFISSKSYVNAARTILYFAQSFQDFFSYLKRKHFDLICDYLTKEGMQDLLKELYEILPELENYQKVSDGSDVEKDQAKVTHIIVKDNIDNIDGKNDLEKIGKDSVIHNAFEDVDKTLEVQQKSIGHSLSQEVADSGDSVVGFLDERIDSKDNVTHLDGMRFGSGDVGFVIKEKLELDNGNEQLHSVSPDTAALPHENLSLETSSNSVIENEMEKYEQTDIIPHDFRDKLTSDSVKNEKLKSSRIATDVLPNVSLDLNESQEESQQLNKVKKQGASSPVLGFQQEMTGGTMEISLDEDDFLNDGPKNVGSRRQSLTSLSSLSSMEISFDPANSESEPIAVPVRRKTSRKSSRTSFSEEGGLKKKKDDTNASPRGSIHSLVEEDTVPFPDVEPMSRSSNLETQSNDDSAIVGEEENKSLPNSLGSTKVKEDLGSPVTKETSQLSQSGEFLQNDELGNSGELEQSGELGSSGGASPNDSSLAAQFQKPKLKSVAKKAAMQLKDKMQDKVAAKTKDLIRQIKEKNLVSRAKVFAENFAQGQEILLPTGEIFYIEPSDNNILSAVNHSESDQPGNTSPEVTVTTDEVDSSLQEIPVDLAELEEATQKAQEMFSNLEVTLSPGALQAVLLEWVTVLNKTFYKLHVKRFSLSGNMINKLDNSHVDEAVCKSFDLENVEQRNTQILKSEADSDNTEGKESGSFVENCVKDNTPIGPYDSGALHIPKLDLSVLISKEFCYVTDPLFLSHDLFVKVCELTQVCFDTECIGNDVNFCNFENIDGHNLEGAFKELNCDIEGDNKRTPNELDVGLELKNPAQISASCDAHFNKKKSIIIDCDKIHKDPSQDASPLSEAEESDILLGADSDTGRDASEKCEEKNVIQGCETDSVGEDERQEDICNLESVGDDVNSLDEQLTFSFSSSYRGSIEAKIGYFVRCYFPYLSKGRVREKVFNGQDQYEIWSALVTCLHAGSSGDGDRYGVEDASIISHLLDSSAADDSGVRLLGHISRLFAVCSDAVVPVCVKCYPQIQPLDVLYMCRYHGVDIETVFTQYMSQMIEDAALIHRQDIESSLYQHPEVRRAWLLSLLKERPERKTKRDDGKPSVHSHKVTWRHEKLLEGVVREACTRGRQVEENVLTMCQDHGYWKGVLKIQKRIQSTAKHLETILHLGDVNLIGEKDDMGYQPTTIDEWDQVLTTFEEFCHTRFDGPLSHPTDDWSYTISWNSLGLLLLKHVGVEESLHLLKKHDLHTGSLEPNFYKACLLSGLVKKHQRLVFHSMLEKVDTYLWSQQPAVLSPQLHYLAENEKKLSSGAENPAQLRQKIQKLAGELKTGSPTPMYVDNTRGHWGVQLQFNRLCPCCNVYLKEPVSQEEPGVLLFPCGHGYHRLCLPGKLCVVCAKKNDV